MKTISLPVLFLLALFITACVNQECDEDAFPKPVLNVAFKQYTDASRTPQKSEDSLVNVTKAYAEGLEDSLFVFTKDATGGTKIIPFHLSPATDSTIFYLETINADKVPQKQFFTVTYNRQPTFISQACGYEVRYTNIAVSATSEDFDDIQVIVPEINPIRNEIHIQLYFKP